MTPTDFAWLFGAALAGTVLLAVIAGIIRGYLTAGREKLQRQHQKAVKSDLKTLKKTQPASYNGDSLEADLEYLCSMVRPESRRERWRHRIQERPDVPVKGCPGEDATGNRYYLASVDGHILAHRDLPELIDDAETVADAILHGRDVPATLSEYYAEELRAGRVDYWELERSVRGDCLTRLRANLERNEEVDLEDLWDRMVYDFRYPPDVVVEKVEQIDGRDARRTKEGTLSWQRY